MLWKIKKQLGISYGKIMVKDFMGNLLSTAFNNIYPDRYFVIFIITQVIF